MTKFRTDFNITGLPKIINHNSKLFFIGSCFTENIGKNFKDYKFTLELNPYGIIYNPGSLVKGLEFIIKEKTFVKNDLFYENNLWSSFYHHSKFSDSNIDTCLDRINSGIKNASRFLRTSDFLFITFGTSRVYTFKNTGEIVSNCHKLPANKFETSFISPAQIVEDYSRIIKQIKEINPGINIVFTISPVRHWQDGAEKNQLSKAYLINAVHQLLDKKKNIFYFPAYEIMIDDLRDYRFYAKDMIHPNEQAIDYIWEKFSDCFIDDNSVKLNKRIDIINKAVSHKAFNSNSPDYVAFKTKNIQIIEEILKIYPNLNFEEELNFFRN